MALLVGLAARAEVMGRRQELWRGVWRGVMLAVPKSWQFRAGRRLRDCEVLHPHFPDEESEVQP